MFEFLTEAFKALSGYPLIQASVAILVLFVGIYIMRRGEKDRKANGNGNGVPSIPAWALYGPAHDAMGAIHEMNEQSRKQCDLLERTVVSLQQIAETTRQNAETMRANAAVLEMIRNESRLR